MKRLPTVCAALALANWSPQSHAATTPPATSPADQPMTTAVPAGAYTLDPAHSSLIFRVNHLGFSNYTARFSHFTAQLQFDPVKLSSSTVTVRIDPRSLELNTPPPGFKDALLGKQWLDVQRFPEITFRSTKVDVSAANVLRIHGDFTLHGVTHPVELDVAYNGGYSGHPLDPHARIGFSAHGAFKRSDFGVAFGVPAPGTTLGVADNVDVLIEAEFNGPAWVASAPAARVDRRLDAPFAMR